MILNNLTDIDGKIISLCINNGVIDNISDNAFLNGTDCSGLTVIPGLIDVHTHGLCGIDTMDCDFEQLCKIYASFGTTSFLPTTMTMPLADIISVTESNTDYYGSNILGFHLEGPYIAESRKGAQDEKNIRKPDVNEFNCFKNVKMITVAPETEGCIEFIKNVSDKTVVSIGHTDCDCKIAETAIDAGAKCLTHTFNAMPPMLHRAPGPIGVAVQKGIFAQIICDGFHIAPSVCVATFRMFGDNTVLISDSIRPAKSADGEYVCGGLPVTLKDNKALLPDGTIAGSVACLFDCVKKAISFGIAPKSAIRAATEAPARMLGIKKGKIEKGYDADLLLLDKDFNIKKIIIGGNFFKEVL